MFALLKKNAPPDANMHSSSPSTAKNNGNNGNNGSSGKKSAGAQAARRPGLTGAMLNQQRNPYLSQAASNLNNKAQEKLFLK